MMYIEAPKYIKDQSILYRHPSIFLAGGITGCPDWQADIVGLLPDNLIIFNPRRASFPIDDPSAALRQITWEYDHFRLVDMILFWFPKESICPIVLYELGAWSMTYKPIFVGVHSEYQRKQDVEIQTRLSRPNVTVVYSIVDLANEVINFMERNCG